MPYLSELQDAAKSNASFQNVVKFSSKQERVDNAGFRDQKEVYNWLKGPRQNKGEIAKETSALVEDSKSILDL